MAKQNSYKTTIEGGTCIITVRKNACCLHFTWTAQLADDTWLFQGMQVTSAHLRILSEADLLQKISVLPPDCLPHHCGTLLWSWGFVPEPERE